MEVCAFVLVAPLTIPTVSLDALASLCRTTSPQHPVWSPLRVWPSGLHCSDPPSPPPAHVAAPGPLCAVGKGADSILSLGAARAPPALCR